MTKLWQNDDNDDNDDKVMTKWQLYTLAYTSRF